MARPVTVLVVFFLALNLFAAMLTGTGVAALLGLDTTVGANQATSELKNQVKDVPTGTSTGGTLFGQYNVLGSFLTNIYTYIFPGLDMLQRVGVPAFIISLLGTLFSLLIPIDIAAYVRGYAI